MKKQKPTQYAELLALSAQRTVRTLFGVIEILLVFRLIFKGLGADTGNSFVKSIYSFTYYIVIIFEGIFTPFKIKIAETTGIIEPSTIIAIVTIGLTAYFVYKLMTPRWRN